MDSVVFFHLYLRAKESPATDREGGVGSVVARGEAASLSSPLQRMNFLDPPPPTVVVGPPA